MTFICSLVTISVNFYFMHYPAFEHSDTLTFALLDCVILHINGKQFRCSVFTFVQYITYMAITDLKRHRPLHIINKLGQFMSILPTVLLPVEKNQKYAKIQSNYRKTQQKHQVENFVKKYCSFFYPHIENIKRK